MAQRVFAHQTHAIKVARRHQPVERERDLVFIAEGPRKSWLRAIVEEVIPGRDGRVRQAIVWTAQGKRLKRPVVRLAVLNVEV